ncbi:MAG TPA: AAA family ATPase, partial [Ktedonobacteraceae bacterium]
LSSGEQHELVLFYELLFKVAPGSLILIDEPELSLHIVWQKQFLQDVQKVTQLSDIDILIATHAPSIIHNRWDLTVGLEEPNN